MVPHGARPALFGTSSGNDNMKSLTMTIVTLHLREGGDVVLSVEAQAEGWQKLAAAR